MRAHLLPVVLLLIVSATTIAHAQTGRKYALLVGVREYNKNELRNLPYSEQDIQSLADVLQGAGFRRVVVLSQTRGAQESRFLPLAANIRTSLSGMLADLAEEDTVVVGFAGHGVQFQGEAGSYFCPMDARLADRSTLVSLEDVYKELEHCPAGFKLLLVDACRNDPQSDHSRSRAQVRLDSVTRPQTRKPPGGVAAFFSCSAGERAFESPELEHGVFFHCVVGALKGDADFDKDQQISLDELVLYAKREVPDRVKDEFGDDVRQMPQFIGSTSGLVPLLSLALPKLEKTIENSIGMKLVLIPAGEFLMGSAESAEEQARRFEGSDASYFEKEHPQHRVKISRPFYLGMHEMTQGQWQSLMETTPWKGQDYVQEGADNPATYVSWEDATEFCRRLSAKEGAEYRLPTEAEWEYACRAGSKTIYSFGDDPAKLGNYAWFDMDEPDASESWAHRVGQKQPNGFGLYDMHGNVCEWCQDFYDEDYYKNSPSTDPTGPSSYSDRVCRGGSWLDSAGSAQSALRHWHAPDVRRFHLGFRVAQLPSGK